MNTRKSTKARLLISFQMIPSSTIVIHSPGIWAFAGCFDEVSDWPKVFSSTELPKAIYWFFLQVLEILQIILKPRKFISTKGKIPILGVCLGFQLMMEQEGAEITRQNQVLHGVETEILADFNSATYRNMKGSIRVGRYHSLQVNPKVFPACTGCKNHCTRSYSPDSSSSRISIENSLACSIILNPFYQTKELRLYLTFSMKAWHKDGAPANIQSLGITGVFTTVRVGTGKKISFFDSHWTALLIQPTVPNCPGFQALKITTKWKNSWRTWSESWTTRICLFENLIGISSRPAESDGNPVEGWLLHYRRPDPVIKSTKEKELYGTLSELEITKEDWVIIDPKENNIRETATSNLIFVKEEGLLIPDKWVLNGIVLQQLLPFLRIDLH